MELAYELSKELPKAVSIWSAIGLSRRRRPQRKKLCADLGIQHKLFTQATNIPSEAELAVLQGYVLDLQKERSKRLTKFINLKKMIGSLFLDLERTIRSDFERAVLDDNVDN